MAAADVSVNTVQVEIEKGPSGLGINIVGGKDSPHFANDTGIFIKQIRPDTSAFHTRQLSEGDRVLSIDDMSLVDVTHDQAVDAFRRSSGIVKLVIEPKAADILLTSGAARSQSAMTISSSSHLTGKVRRTSADHYRNSSLRSSPANPNNVYDLVNPHVQENAKTLNAQTLLEEPASTPQSPRDRPPLPPLGSQALRAASAVASSARRPRDESRMSLTVVDDADDRGAASRRYFIARDLAYTAVGLATVAAFSVFVYRRFNR